MHFQADENAVPKKIIPFNLTKWPSNPVCDREDLPKIVDLLFTTKRQVQQAYSSPSASLSSSSLTTPITPPPLPSSFSFNARPASRSFAPNALRAPKVAPTSHIWSLAFDPAAASVRGSSGDHTVENTLPCEKREIC